MADDRTLDEVLADAREEVATLRRNRAGLAPDRADEILDAIGRVTESFRRFLPEPEARLYSGHSVEWLRARFADWQQQGHARLHGRVRAYRMVVLPRRADTVGAHAAGLAGERKAG